MLKPSAPTADKPTLPLYLLFLGALCTSFAAFSAFAEDERIVVVGSRATAPRVAVDANVPIDVITANDIARAGFSETAQIIQSLIPSFNFSISTVSDGTDTVRPATLRGLWPDQVLVLINGKRRHTSALIHINGSVGRGTSGVDLNAIPPSAIERIEILRDGAAAQYGSDAIAGVINVVLKNQAQGGEVDAYWGQTYKGDGEQHRASFNGGLALADDGFVNLTAERRNRDHTNRAGNPRYRAGDADSDNDYFFFNSELPLSGDIVAYAFGGASERDAQSAGFYRFADTARNNNMIYPDGFLPLLNPEVDDQSVALGIRGELGGWGWDASVNYGTNRFDFLITNSLNVTYGADSPTRADSGGLEFTQWTWNFDAVRDVDWFAHGATVAAGLEYRVDEYEIHAGERVSWADGGEQEYPDDPAVRAPQGIQVFPGFRPENEVTEGRGNYAAYFDVEGDLSDKLHLGAALRYEDYDDFGDNLSGKLTARYDFTDAFALRGAVSTGFRAPSLGQQYFNNVSTQFIQGIPREVGTLRNDDALLRMIEVDELKEEESVHYSFGAVAKPFANMTVSFDAYYIDIDNRITFSSQYNREDFDDGSAVQQEMDARGIGRFQFFTNAVDTYTRGIDVVADYFFDFDAATLGLSAAAHVGSTKAGDNVNEPAGVVSGKSVFDRRERLLLETGQPRQHLTFAADYDWGDYELNARLSRYGSVRITESDGVAPQHYQADWITDVSASRRFAQGFTWTVGAKNLFDVYPERNNPDKVSTAHIFTYSRRASPFGFNGGFYYASLKYEFGSQ